MKKIICIYIYIYIHIHIHIFILNNEFDILSNDVVRSTIGGDYIDDVISIVCWSTPVGHIMLMSDGHKYELWILYMFLQRRVQWCRDDCHGVGLTTLRIYIMLLYNVTIDDVAMDRLLWDNWTDGSWYRIIISSPSLFICPYPTSMMIIIGT